MGLECQARARRARRQHHARRRRAPLVSRHDEGRLAASSTIYAQRSAANRMEPRSCRGIRRERGQLMNGNNRSLCGAIGVAPALRQVPPSSRHGREACAQELAEQEHSTRMSTKGPPVIHWMCFASSSNRMRCIGKGRSVLSAILAYRKHPTQSSGVFRVGGPLRLFRSTSRKQGTVPFRPPSPTQSTYANKNRSYMDGVEAEPNAKLP
jgi:hypothetical protein